MKIQIQNINSSSIQSVCSESGISEIEFLGHFEHPDHPGNNDWAIDLYKLDSGHGGRVADTNSDPVWEDADPAAFSQFLADYKILEESKTNYYAAVNENETAFGTGLTPDEAREDSRQWCDFADECKIVEITENSYNRIKAGNPDAVEIVK